MRQFTLVGDTAYCTIGDLSITILDISDIIDIFYDVGATYVKLPISLSAEIHSVKGGVTTNNPEP